MIEELMRESRGRIFLVQLARAIDHAQRQNNEELLAHLRAFAIACAARVADGKIYRDNEGELDAERSFYRPIVVEDQDRYLHLDPTEVDTSAQLATVVPYSALRKYLLVDDFLREDDSNKTIEVKLSKLRAENWKSDAKVGYKADPPTRHFWATTFERLHAVAPSLGKKIILPRNEAERLRSHLGLGHFGFGVRLAVLIFDRTALTRHTNDGDGKVTRPFLFEGVGNHRFHIFDRGDPPGWNHALDLDAIPKKVSSPLGAPEIVVTSMSCREVRRVCVTDGLSPSPCHKQEPEIERIMLDQIDVPVEAAGDRVRRLLEAGA